MKDTKFKKGFTPWNKGKITGIKSMLGKYHSQKSIEKMAIANKGKHYSPNTEFKKGHTTWNKGLPSSMKGKHLLEETRLNRKDKMIKNKTLMSGEKSHLFGKKLFGKDNPFYDKKHSETHKQKLREIIVKTTKRLREEGKLVIPKKDTSIEIKIQNFLKHLGIEYFTHQYMHIEHGYQCDILIPSMNLVIECDGDYWHKYPIGREIDNIRTSELLDKGFKVLRLWEFEINAININEFKERLDFQEVKGGLTK